MNLPDDPFMLQAMLAGFQAQRDKVNSAIAEIERKLGMQPSSVQSTTTAFTPSVPAYTPQRTFDIPDLPAAHQPRATRNISAEARQRIVEAQKKRWAKTKAEQERLRKMDAQAKSGKR